MVTVRAMRAVVQRVRYAKVSVNGELISSIARGFCILLGVSVDDSEADVAFMASKLAGLRVFEDSTGKMNLAAREVQGELLLVSQFTLFGDVRRGNRPSFTQAAPPEVANRLFEELVERLRVTSGCEVRTGRFRSHMDVELANDGPVTILIDSKKDF
jgi:D-tyrosyl-tRNA(Tyr) deacylase